MDEFIAIKIPTLPGYGRLTPSGFDLCHHLYPNPCPVLPQRLGHDFLRV